MLLKNIRLHLQVNFIGVESCRKSQLATQRKMGLLLSDKTCSTCWRAASQHKVVPYLSGLREKQIYTQGKDKKTDNQWRNHYNLFWNLCSQSGRCWCQVGALFSRNKHKIFKFYLKVPLNQIFRFDFLLQCLTSAAHSTEVCAAVNFLTALKCGKTTLLLYCQIFLFAWTGMKSVVFTWIQVFSFGKMGKIKDKSATDHKSATLLLYYY